MTRRRGELGARVRGALDSCAREGARSGASQGPGRLEAPESGPGGQSGGTARVDLGPPPEGEGSAGERRGLAFSSAECALGSRPAAVPTRPPAPAGAPHLLARASGVLQRGRRRPSIRAGPASPLSARGLVRAGPPCGGGAGGALCDARMPPPPLADGAGWFVPPDPRQARRQVFSPEGPRPRLPGPGPAPMGVASRSEPLGPSWMEQLEGSSHGI